MKINFLVADFWKEGLSFRLKMLILVTVQSLSRVQLFAAPWTAACQASLSITTSWSLLKLCHWVDDGIQPSHPLSRPSPPVYIFPSIRVFLFQWVGSSHQVAKIFNNWLMTKCELAESIKAKKLQRTSVVAFSFQDLLGTQKKDPDTGGSFHKKGRWGD